MTGERHLYLEWIPTIPYKSRHKFIIGGTGRPRVVPNSKLIYNGFRLKWSAPNEGFHALLKQRAVMLTWSSEPFGLSLSSYSLVWMLFDTTSTLRKQAGRLGVVPACEWSEIYRGAVGERVRAKMTSKPVACMHILSHSPRSSVRTTKIGSFWDIMPNRLKTMQRLRFFVFAGVHFPPHRYIYIGSI